MAARTREALPQEIFAELERALSSAPPLRAYLLRGEERYFRDRAVALIAGKASELGHEVTRHDGSDPDFAATALLDDLAGAPMFAAGRCIVLRDPEVAKKPALLDKRPDGKPSGFTKSALQWLEDPARAGTLVVSSRGMRADHAVAKAIQKAGGALLAFRKLYDTPPAWKPDPADTELAQWLLRRARELGVKLSPRDAGYVAAATGNDLTGLDTQLEKLRHGGDAAVREIVGWESSAAPWALAEPLLDGDLPRTLGGLQALFASGFESSGKRERSPDALAAILLGTLRNQVRQLVAGARALAGGASGKAALVAAGYKGPPRGAEAFEARVRTRPPAAWERMLEEVGELERRTRTGGTVDQTDFVELALRWSRSRAEAPRRRN